MPVARYDTLDACVEAILRETSIPSVSLVVRTDGAEVYHRTAGDARRSPRRPAPADQPYDLASVTKALAGSTVAASLVEEGALSLEDPICDTLPGAASGITLAHLLTHSSGLPKWNAFYATMPGAWGTTDTRAAMMQAAIETPLEAPPGTRHAYTDVGFLVLLALLEKVGGARIDVLFQERILGPAGETDLRWGWPLAAATEDCPVRGGVVEGTVHDLNCAALGGISSHAGLFGTARSVARLGDTLRQAVATPDAFPTLPGRTLGSFWTLRGAGSHVGGWDTPTRGGYTSTGASFPDDAVGHLGYTGTSLWIAPSKQTVVALLTNRVHPTDTLDAIRAARPRIHDAVANVLGWTS